MVILLIPPNNGGMTICPRASPDALKKAGGKVDVLGVDLSNPGTGQQKLQSLLAQDPSINGVITLNAAGAAAAIPAAATLVRADQFFLATFDLSPAIVQSVEQGHMLFAVDQQPYLQGYLAIVLLSLYKSNLDTVSTAALSTGPIFVTSANVAQIKQLEDAGSR
jgi:simple sugar transport system substrate-binding protein